MAKRKLGFVGLGIMGRPMCKNLIDAGYSVTVWNRSQPGIDECVRYGAATALSAKGVAEKSEVVITMVTASADVQGVVLGSNGVLEGASPGMVLIDMSSISPKVTKEIADRLIEKGIKMLDAPVSGNESGAKAGTLSIMVGGPKDVFEECLPMCEGLTLAVKLELDIEKVLCAIRAGGAASRALDEFGPMILRRNLEPGFFVKHFQKDLRIVMETAADLKIPLPGTALVHQLYSAVEADGLSEKGEQALIRAFEKLANIEVKR